MNTELHSLTDLLSPVTQKQFLDNYLSKDVCLIKGTPQKFEGLFTWELLNDFLLSQRVDYPRLRLIKDGEVVNPSRYLISKTGRRGEKYNKVSLEKLYNELKRGTAIHLTGIEELSPKLNGLAIELENDLLTRIETTLHVGINESVGFHPHFDAHDVFVLQVAGNKKWQLYGFKEQYPVRVGPSEKVEISEKPLLELTLHQGDLLYLPRGYWHSAQAFVDPSLHISIGMTNPLGFDYLLWLNDNMKIFDVFRRDIPRHFGIEEKTLFLNELKAKLLEGINQTTLDRFCTEFPSKHSLVKFDLPNIR